MQSLPDLTHLSHAQKDALIQVLWQQVQELTTQMQEMQKCGGQVFSDTSIGFLIAD